MSSKPVAVNPVSRSQILAQRASSGIDFDARIAFRYLVRSADAVLRQARVYDDEDNLEKAYVLYLRYIELVLNFIPQHPQASSVQGRAQLKKMNMV